MHKHPPANPALILKRALRSMNDQPLLKRLKRLGAGLASPAAKHQLRLEAPGGGDLPLGLGGGVNDRVVVLQVRAEALVLEARPQHQLVHRARVLAPLREFVRVQREVRLQRLDWCGVFEEEDLCACQERW